MTGNGDAHAKNFSILQDVHGQWKPAPAYDVPTSQPYGDNTMALSVAGKRDGNISGPTLVALGVGLGLNERAARKAVATVADEVDAWLAGVDDLPFDGGRRKSLRRVITYRQRILRT